MKLKNMLAWTAIVAFTWSCGDAEETSEITDPNAVPEIYNKLYGATSITSDGTYVMIESTGMPDHSSVYYSANDNLYQDFSGSTFAGNTFKKNPNIIASINYTFKIPINPAVDANHAATPLGAIGIAINGVPFFNQYAGPNQPLTDEAASFDQYWGHPAQQGEYHYHVEPLWLTEEKVSKSDLLGFLLDGFPVYGPMENGAIVTNAMLDDYHGHTTATVDYPDGIYHYHINDTDPYINGSGYYGKAGTVSK